MSSGIYRLIRNLIGFAAAFSLALATRIDTPSLATDRVEAPSAAKLERLLREALTNGRSSLDQTAYAVLPFLGTELVLLLVIAFVPETDALHTRHAEFSLRRESALVSGVLEFGVRKQKHGALVKFTVSRLDRFGQPLERTARAADLIAKRFRRLDRQSHILSRQFHFEYGLKSWFRTFLITVLRSGALSASVWVITSISTSRRAPPRDASA